MAFEQDVRDIRDRLTRVETKQDAIKDELDDVRKKVDNLNTNMAKAGGAMIALTALGAFFGWVITQADKIIGWFRP